jgi:hypothetical protein
MDAQGNIPLVYIKQLQETQSKLVSSFKTHGRKSFNNKDILDSGSDKELRDNRRDSLGDTANIGPPSFYVTAVNSYMSKFDGAIKERADYKKKVKKQFWFGNPKHNTNVGHQNLNYLTEDHKNTDTKSKKSSKISYLKRH